MPFHSAAAEGLSIVDEKKEILDFVVSSSTHLFHARFQCFCSLDASDILVFYELCPLKRFHRIQVQKSNILGGRRSGR